MLGVKPEKIVVADCMETEEWPRLVLSEGCHEGKGYQFGRPMTVEAVRVRLAEPANAQGQMVA